MNANALMRLIEDGHRQMQLRHRELNAIRFRQHWRDLTLILDRPYDWAIDDEELA